MSKKIDHLTHCAVGEPIDTFLTDLTIWHGRPRRKKSTTLQQDHPILLRGTRGKRFAASVCMTKDSGIKFFA